MTSGIKKALYYNKNIILQILVTRQNNQTLTQEDWKDCIEFSALWSCSGTLPVLLMFLSDWFLFKFTTWGFACEGVEISSPNFASNFLPTISSQYEQFWTSITKLWSTSLRKNVHKKYLQWLIHHKGLIQISENSVHVSPQNQILDPSNEWKI